MQDKIRIRVFTKDMAQYQRFLPTGDLCKPLADAVFFYIGDQLEWEVELAIPAGEVVPTQLGKFGQTRLDQLDGAELDLDGRISMRCALSSGRTRAPHSSSSRMILAREKRLR